MPAAADDDPPPPTLEYRSGTDDPVTDWRGGFDVLELLAENLLGLVLLAAGLLLAVAGISVVVFTLASRTQRRHLILAVPFASILWVFAGLLLFIGRQFISLPPRR